MVYVAGKPDHKMDNTKLVDHIVELVEKKAAEIESKRDGTKAKPALAPAK